MQTLRRSTLLHSCQKACQKACRKGFTLIELLAVILIIGILMTFLLPRIPEAIDAARVTACKKNMQEIWNGLMIYHGKYNRVPTESGARFLGVLISRGALENSEDAVRRLTCPGVDLGSLTIGELEPEEWFADLELVDGTYTSYAARNTKDFPLRKFPGSGKEALVADDNDPEMNHITTTVVLYLDGHVGTFELELEREKGTVGPEEDVLLVGPESPIEVLQKLSLD